jgi:hypothetical protein
LKSGIRTAGPRANFYWDDMPGPRLNPDAVDSQTALEWAKAFARAERNNLEQAR